MAPRDSEDLLLNWLERLEVKLDAVITDRVSVEQRLTALEQKRSTGQKMLLAFASFASGITAWLLNR